MAIKNVETVINGVTTTYVLNASSGYYERELTAPNKSSYNVNAGHYYPITIRATDDAGNVTILTDGDSVFGNSLKLFVKESVPPVSTITYPSDDASLTNAKPTISWTVIDNDSGVDSSTIGITIDDGNKITSGIIKVPVTGGYDCSYTISSNLSDGSHIIKVDAQDYDKNDAVQRTVSFTVDTIPPELNLTSPANNLITNNPQVTVSGTARDITAGLATVTVKVNNSSPVTVNVGSNNAFSTSVSLSDGTNIITVRATDKVGKYSEIVRTVTIDRTAPIISEIKIAPNPVGTSEPVKISIKAID